MLFLKADTNTEVLIGPVVAVGDGFTPVTTLALGTADEAEIIKYGGATPLTVTNATANGFAAITDADGYYTMDLSTSDTDTEGFLSIVINDDSLCLPVRVDFMVVNANVYDSLFAASGTDVLDVNTTQISGTTQTANDVGQDVNDILTDTADMQPKLGTVSDLGGGATVGANLSDMAGATFATSTDSQEAIRDHIGNGSNLTEAGGTGDQLSAIPWNASWDAEVESEVNDALDTAISELGVGAPTATPTIRTAIMLLYMALRNKTVVQTSGTDALEIYNDAGTKICSKALTDDGSDYTEAEMVSG